MSKNILYPGPGLSLSLPVAANTESGDPVVVGDQGMVGVAETDRGEGGNASTHATVKLPNVYAADLSVYGHNGSTNTAVAIGDKVYFSGTQGDPLDVNSSDTHFGWALETVGAGETDTILVALTTP